MKYNTESNNSSNLKLSDNNLLESFNTPKKMGDISLKELNMSKYSWEKYSSHMFSTDDAYKNFVLDKSSSIFSPQSEKSR